MALEENDTELHPLEGELAAAVGESNASPEEREEDEGLAAGYETANSDEYLDGDEANTQREERDGDGGGEATDANGARTPAPPAASPAPKAASAVFGKWTEEQIEERFRQLDELSRGQQTVSGRVGDLLSRLEQKGGRKITKESLKGVVKEFGEDFAEALAQDLNDAGLGGSVGVTQEQVETLVQQRAEALVSQRERGFERKLVRVVHPDAEDHFSTQSADGKWTKGAKHDKFRAWVTSLPEDRQRQIASSWDSDVMIAALTDFKASEKQQKPAGSPGAPVAPPRQSRVDRAVTPRGTGTTTQPSEDPMLAGYKLAKSGRG